MRRIWNLGIGMLLISLLLVACKDEKSKAISEVKFNPQVLAFSSGMVSVESIIKIQLNRIDTEYKNDEPITDKLFEIKPKVEGETYQIGNEFFFKPKEKLSPDTKYSITFNVDKVVKTGLDKKDSKFNFEVKTPVPSFDVITSKLSLYDESRSFLYYIEYVVETNDFAEDKAIEDMISITGISAKPKWTHENRRHSFVLDSLSAGENSVLVGIKANAKPIKGSKEHSSEIKIPSKYEFILLGTTVHSEAPQKVVLQFSSPINSSQKLNGFINMEGKRFTYKVRLNELSIYPSEKIVGTVTLNIHEGIQNSAGGKLKEAYSEDVVFETLNPEIKLIGKGTILPNSEGLIVPFQAVNMKAVQVKVIKVFENNIHQFLQVNTLGGEKEIKRAGRLIAVKTIRLDNNFTEQQLGRWNTFALDLAELISVEPGAIYRIEMDIKKKDAIMDCVSDSEEEDEDSYTPPDYTDEELFNRENANYDGTVKSNDYYDYYYDDYYDYYDYYDNSEDACSESYYRHKSVARNVLASNLGIIAKQGTDSKIKVLVSDLVNLSARQAVEVEVFNYQKQSLGKGVTNNEGVAEIEVKRGTPFILVAKSGKEKGYLHLQDGFSLSLSSFDVSGSEIQKGLKGYIYGERGVWRPGDTLFLGFVLQDLGQTLPKGHPINMEIQNARGQVVNKQTRPGNEHGFYTFNYQTDQDAPTGNWIVRVNVGGVSFTKTLKVETVKPNRLKINIDFGDNVIGINKPLKAKLSAKWLHGTPAKNMDADIKLYLKSKTTHFPAWKEYVFDDVTKESVSEEISFFDGSLNSEGEVNLTDRINVEDASGMLEAQFVTRVFEGEGDFSIDNFKVDVSPYDKYVGILKPKGNGYFEYFETDKETQFGLALVNKEGKPSEGKIKVRVYKMVRNWWWSSSNSRLANYTSSSYSTLVKEEIVTTSGGRGVLSFKVKESDYGHYLIRATDASGKHSSSVLAYFDWPWGPPRSGDGQGASLLNISIDKDKYQVGETAKLSFPSTTGTKALVSIETGTKVLESYWINGEDKRTTLNLKITEEMTPNIYVNLTLVQPHAQTKNDAPIRLYGVIPIVAEDPATKLNPVITMEDKLKPEEKYTIEVSEANNKEMTYTLAVVDEGLLDLTRFQTPNPWGTFFAREALGVRTWDMYNSVVGAYGGRIEQLFAIGGDDALDANKPKVSRFKPVVTFMGPFTLKKGSNKHQLTMPNYIGSVRVMVVAGNNKAYGSAEKAVPVKKPLMVLATIPRVLGPGEEVQIPVNVFALEPNIRKVDVKLEVNDMFEMVDNSKSVSFSQVGDEVVNLKMKVKNKTGKGTIKVVGTGGGETSTYEVEIEVRNPNQPLTRYETKLLAAGEKISYKPLIDGIDGDISASLETSVLPPLNLENRLEYLIRYPHGCMEQITSTGFPQLYLSSILEMNDTEKQKTEYNVKAVLDKYKNYVTTEGGFAYWPGQREFNLWATSYAGDFMLEAQAKGYTVSSSMLRNWTSFQKREAKNWTPKTKNGNYYSYSQTDLDQAYRLYTLAKAKSPELGAMNRLKAQTNLSKAAKWTLAAAYVLAGQKEAGESLIKGEDSNIGKYTSSYSQTYGSSTRDKAMVVDALVHLGDNENAFKVIKDLSGELQSNRWMSTQTTAYTLMAISRYAEKNATSGEIQVSYTLDGKSNNIKSRKNFVRTDLGKIKTTSEVQITNNSKAPIYVQYFNTGIPLSGTETEIESGISMRVEYTNGNGAIIDVSKIEQGTDFVATVTLQNKSLNNQWYSNLALTQVFPSGWEITNDRLLGLANSGNYDYLDIRDDRVYTYFGLGGNSTIRFRVNLNAAYLGKFYLPATKVEAMYDGSVNANNLGTWVEVVK